MSNLVIPRRGIRTKQPTSAVEIDWSAPITAGLISAILPSAKLFAGTSPSSGGFTATNHLVTEHGIALGRNGGAWSLTQRPISGIAATSDMTMLAFMYGDSTVLTESNPVTTGQSAAAISSSICVGDGTTKALRYRIYLGATRYAGGSYVIPAKPTVVIGRQRYGVEQALFVDGEKDPITGSYTGAISGVTHFGSYNGNASTRVLLSAIWARALSDEEIRSISANPWQIFAPRETRLFVPVSAGGQTTVTIDSTAAYKIQGSVQSGSTANYALRASVQNDTASEYSIRGSIQQSTTPAYLIRGLVDQAIAAIYGIRTSVSGDAAANYIILSASSVSASTSAGYNIRGSSTHDTTASYALRGAVTQDTSALYSILSASSVTSSITVGYAIKSSVQAEIAASYIIRSGVVSEAQAAYIIRGLVQQSIDTSYAINGEQPSSGSLTVMVNGHYSSVINVLVRDGTYKDVTVFAKLNGHYSPVVD